MKNTWKGHKTAACAIFKRFFLLYPCYKMSYFIFLARKIHELGHSF